jgi:hypothetical protein
VFERAKLVKWLKQQGKTAAAMETNVRYFELKQKGPNKPGITRIMGPPLPFSEEFISETANELDAFVSEHARSVGGNIGYELICRFGTEETMVLLFDHFATEGSESRFQSEKGAVDMVRILGDQIVAREKGTWGMVNALFERSESMHKSQTDVIKMQNERIENMEGMHLKTIKLFEQLLSSQQDRELKLEAAKLDEARKVEMIRQGTAIAMLVGSHWIQKNLPSAKGAFDTEMLKVFVNSITPEQMEKVVSSELLTQEQKAQLVSLPIALGEGADISLVVKRLSDSLSKEQMGKIATAGIFTMEQLAMLQRLLAA